MDNEFTRKEVKCPLLGEYCNREDKDCNICIGEEMEFEATSALRGMGNGN